jgi:hypothetical protein
MTDAVAIQIAQTAGICFSTVGSIFAAWFAYLSNKNSKRNSEHLTVMGEAVAAVEKQTNHIKDELVAATDKAGRAEGKAEGRAALLSEQKEDNK